MLKLIFGPMQHQFNLYQYRVVKPEREWQLLLRNVSGDKIEPRLLQLKHEKLLCQLYAQNYYLNGKDPFHNAHS